MPRFLLPSLAYNRSAILRAAWAEARSAVIVAGRSIGPFKGRVTTARAEFPAALRHVWSLARSERSIAEWKAGYDAEASRVAALPERARMIVAAETALMIAEHADSFSAANNAAVAAASARLHSLQLHA